MVFENDCTKIILKEFPEFEKSELWKEHCRFWGDEVSGLGNEVAVFGDFVEQMIINNEFSIDLKRVFDFIEKLMVEGDSTVKDVIATCFLENLLNYYSAGNIDALKFTPLLGPESRKYCKAWDEFTGVKTPGV